ncbi:ATP-binding protein [Bacillus tianshenii]|nr:ATP-binding protein [Bacillus tianshenii]
MKREREQYVFSIEGYKQYVSLREEVNGCLQRSLGDQFYFVEIAINEAVNNCFFHGTPNLPAKSIMVQLEIRALNKKTMIRIRDNSVGFAGNDRLRIIGEDVQGFKENSLYGESGRGIFMMRELVDRMMYNKQGNELLLVKDHSCSK